MMKPLLSPTIPRLILDDGTPATSGCKVFVDPDSGQRFEIPIGELRKAITPAAGAARYERVRFATGATALTDNSAVLVREPDDGVRMLVSRDDIAEINGAFARRARFADAKTASRMHAALHVLDEA